MFCELEETWQRFLFPRVLRIKSFAKLLRFSPWTKGCRLINQWINRSQPRWGDLRHKTQEQVSSASLMILITYDLSAFKHLSLLSKQLSWCCNVLISSSLLATPSDWSLIVWQGLVSGHPSGGGSSVLVALSVVTTPGAASSSWSGGNRYFYNKQQRKGCWVLGQVTL